MKITRRDAIRNCIVFSIGTVLIPSCLQDKSKSSGVYKNLKLDDSQEQLIAELSETIIPRTDTPGAKDTYTHLFVLKRLDDSYSRDEQQKFLKGLEDFDKLSDKKFDKSFVASTTAQKEELIKAIEDNKDIPGDIAAFYTIMKKLTIQGYMTSKYYLTDVQIYKLVPGKFKGCVPAAAVIEKGASI